MAFDNTAKVFKVGDCKEGVLMSDKVSAKGGVLTVEVSEFMLKISDEPTYSDVPLDAR